MKMEDAMQQFKKVIQRISDVLEQAVAVLVLIGIVFSLYSLVKDFVVFQNLLNDVSMFRGYLEDIFIIVIGLEFLQMLCRPNSDNIIEVLIFLVARHMIITDTTPYEDFVSVISIILLCILRRYLHSTRYREHLESDMTSDEQNEIDD